jgi:putative transposase
MSVTLRQIAEKMNVTVDSIKKRCRRDAWPSCGNTIINHNETKLYALADLPADIRALVDDCQNITPITAAIPAAGPEASTGPSPKASGPVRRAHVEPITPTPLLSPVLNSFTELKDWQRDIMIARLAIIGAVESIATAEGLTINRAIERFLELLAGGMIDAAICDMAETANHRKGNDRSLSRGTIYRWIRDKKQQGNLGLAPADKEQMTVPLWAREFLALHRLPSKPTVPMVLEKMGDHSPSYGQAVRFLKKFSRVDAQRGRMSGSELRSIRGYTQRDKSDLMPMDVVVADGHSFKAKVAHPVHGKPFHPEMEGIIDAATRVCIGWSIGLAESSHVVADALRHAVTVSEKKPFGGVPAIFYADQGAGNTAKAVSHVEMGVLARIGSQFKTGIPGNPQGRGVIEKLQESLWIRAAKELPTYTGKDMDQLALRRIMKIVNKDIAATGASEQLITWSRFLHFAGEQVAAYNNRPHSAHPKISDMQTGLRRHMTPGEMWQAFAADGWQPTLLSDDEIKDLFKPMVRVKIRRAQVTVFGNIYYHKSLEHYHGEDALVNYDIHDAKIVWVRDTSQRLICEAVWDANKRDYFPVPVIEQARQKRMEGRLKRLEDQAYEIKQERKGVIGSALPQEDPIIADMAPDEPEPEREIVMSEYDISEAV